MNIVSTDQFKIISNVNLKFVYKIFTMERFTTIFTIIYFRLKKVKKEKTLLKQINSKTINYYSIFSKLSLFHVFLIKSDIFEPIKIKISFNLW